jgi:dTDP-4-amino-4,6-dideoxygalactose transaminase
LTLLITSTTAVEALTPRTKAIIAVHLYGQMCDMGALSRLAAKAHVSLVEDAAQAHGATWYGRPVGTWSAAATFSFYPGKNLGAFGDGGAVITNDPGVAHAVKALRDHGRVDGDPYMHSVVATNSRLDTIQAAVLSAKLPHLDEWNEARRRVAAEYLVRLDDPNVPVVSTGKGALHSYHLFVIRVARRAQVREALAARGIGTGVHYPTPIHLLPPYAHYAEGRTFPVAEAAARSVLSLPMHPFLTAPEVETVVTALHEVVGERRGLHV